MAATQAAAVRQLQRNRQIIHILQQRRGPQLRIFRDRSNPFELYNDDNFRYRYRLSKPTVIEIIEMLRPDLERPTQRNHALPVHLQVLTTLRVFAVGKCDGF